MAELTASQESQIDVAGQAVQTAEERGLFAATLCGRCQSGHLYRRKGQVSFIAYCSAIRRAVPTDIVECSAFSDTKKVSLYDMQQIALLVDGREGIHDKAYL